jgi:hypothetical protein
LVISEAENATPASLTWLAVVFDDDVFLFDRRFDFVDGFVAPPAEDDGRVPGSEVDGE